MSRPFLKMNGAGNDFVVVEARRQPFAPQPAQVRAIADRAGPSGCDQLIAIEPSAKADAFMRIWNNSGGQVDACGNATRCVGWLLLQEGHKDQATIETNAGMIGVERAGPERVRVDMGQPKLQWFEIPLAQPMDTLSLDLSAEPDLAMPGAVNMGNPHVVFFVADVEAMPLAEIGPRLEFHPLFPEQVNVGFAEIKSRDRIRLRVWERGAGLTKACGTGACAALVAASRRGLVGRHATVEMDGGELLIEWRESDGHVLMTGPVQFEFTGVQDMAGA
ncbi:MAG: dapF [Caulobacteraceae bacterium]|nr:dapF [Caulobacteraceae bacterium]